MSVTVDVSQGEKQLRWVRITETTGADLTVDQVQLSLTPTSSGVHAWLAADDSEQVTDSVVRVALLVDDRFEPGQYVLRAKVDDNPEVDFVHPENAAVTVK